MSPIVRTLAVLACFVPSLMGQAPASDVEQWMLQADGFFAKLDWRHAELPSLAAWQNRNSVSETTLRRRLGLRLLQARVQLSSFGKALETLTELEADRDFAVCRSPWRLLGDESERFTCAELARLTGMLWYSVFSQPDPWFADSFSLDCWVLFRTQADQMSCLDKGRLASETAMAEFKKLSDDLKAGKPPSRTLCQAARGSGQCEGAALVKSLEGRIDVAAVSAGLALQERGEPEKAIPLLERYPAPEAILALARAYRDLGESEKAKAQLKKLPVVDRAKASPQQLEVEWRRQLVDATLGTEAEGRRKIEAAFGIREQVLAKAVQDAGFFDIYGRVSEGANAEDVALSYMLTADPKLESGFFRHLCATLGTSAYATRQLLAQLREPQHQALFEKAVRAVGSEPADWGKGNLLSASRRTAREALEKALGESKLQVALEPAEKVWQEFWSKQQGRQTELVVVLLWRPYSLKQKTASAMRATEYLLLHFTAPNLPPRMVRLADAHQIDRGLEAWQENVEAKASSPWLDEFSKKVEFPASKPGKVPRRMVVLAMGRLQSLPWALVRDQAGKELLESYSFVSLDSLRDVAGWGSPASAGTSPAAYVGVPDLAGMGALLRTGSLGQLAARPWTAKERQASRKGWNALRKLDTQALPFEDNKASESELRRQVNPRYLYLFTHGAYLREAVGLAPWDRAVLLTADGDGQDGVLLASEVKFLRLETRFVGLGACKGSQGTVRRNEPLEGLRSSFHAAGAKAVAAPIWDVETEPTGALFAALFQSKEDWDIALQKAQLALRETMPLRAWGGWMLSGDPLR